METAEDFLPHLKLEQLHDISGEDLEFEVEVFETFVQQFNQSLGRLQEGLDSKDKEKALLYSHDIKGSARNIGAEEIGRVAKTMEDAARSGDLPAISKEMPELKSVFAELERIFSVYVKWQEEKTKKK